MMEPERPIEKLLRNYSRKREQEAGAPLEMHPATRKLLQGEITRKHPRSAHHPQSFRALLSVLWPRLIWGLGALTVLALIAALILPSLQKKPETFYAQEDAAPAVLVAPESPADTTASTPALAFNETDRTESGAMTLADQENQPRQLTRNTEARTRTDPPAEAAPALAAGTAGSPLAAAAPGAAPEADAFRRRYGLAPAGGAEPSPRLGVNEERLRAKDNFTPLTSAPLSLDGGKQVATAEPEPQNRSQEKQLTLAQPPRPTSGAEAPARAAFKAEALGTDPAGTKVQRFAKVERADEKAKRDASTSPADQLLVSFQLQQEGRQLRIVDADGSVYTGYLQPNTNTRARAALPKGAEAVASDKLSAPEQELKKTPAALAAGAAVKAITEPEAYSFTVEGTNGTLKERVVFVGNLSTVSLAVGISVTNAVGRLTDTREAQEANLFKANSRITGRARVGNRPEIEIQAVPVTP